MRRELAGLAMRSQLTSENPGNPAPGRVTDWPWPLTPLTSRSTAGWFAFGLVGFMFAQATRWSAARVIVESMLLGLAIGLVSVARAWDEFDTGRTATWVFLTSLIALTALMAALYVGMERRRRGAYAGFSATSTT